MTPGNLAGLAPLGLRNLDHAPKKTRKSIPRESKKRKAAKATSNGKTGREHMARVAQLPCVICRAWPVEVHHVISDRYSQRKASDFEVIPLCFAHHRGPEGIHAGKSSWEDRYGKDYDYLPTVAKLLGVGE